MVNTKIICKTDAEVLLDFVQLKDSGFAFSYAKTEDGISQKYVNCNGRVFGPYDSVYLSSHSIESAEWAAYKGEFELSFKNNGKECKTEKKKKDGSPGLLTQKEIDLLLTAIADGEASAPDEEYDEVKHILKLNRRKQEFFCTNKKRYGPYNTVLAAEYFDDEHFQFTYRKRANSKRWYYNLNGKEIDSFSNSSCFHTFYDKNNHAILDHLKDNCVYIDGQKIRCFNAKVDYCSFYSCNEHEIFVGQDSNGKYHVNRDGVEQDFCAGRVTVLDNGDLAYSKIQGKSETWFYNDKQISVPVNGYSSEIYDSLISYKRNNIPYFFLKNTEYNGMSIYDIDEGFVFLDDHSICFLPWIVPNYHRIVDGTISNEEYNRAREGNYIYLYNTNRFAGRD